MSKKVKEILEVIH